MSRESDEKARSLTRPTGGLSVAASPFNGVKLDLAVILIVALVLGLLHGRLVEGLLAQLLLLGGFACLAAGWLIWRTRQIVRRESERQAGNGTE